MVFDWSQFRFLNLLFRSKHFSARDRPQTENVTAKTQWSSRKVFRKCEMRFSFLVYYIIMSFKQVLFFVFGFHNFTKIFRFRYCIRKKGDGAKPGCVKKHKYEKRITGFSLVTFGMVFNGVMYRCIWEKRQWCSGCPGAPDPCLGCAQHLTRKLKKFF